MRERGAVCKSFNGGDIFAEDRALLMEPELDYRMAEAHIQYSPCPLNPGLFTVAVIKALAAGSTICISLSCII